MSSACNVIDPSRSSIQQRCGIVSIFMNNESLYCRPGPTWDQRRGWTLRRCSSLPPKMKRHAAGLRTPLATGWAPWCVTITALVFSFVNLMCYRKLWGCTLESWFVFSGLPESPVGASQGRSQGPATQGRHGVPDPEDRPEETGLWTAGSAWGEGGERGGGGQGPGGGELPGQARHQHQREQGDGTHTWLLKGT